MENQYSAFNMMPPVAYIQPANQRLEKVLNTTTQRKITNPIVVNRSDLINALTGATDEYKKALNDYNNNKFTGIVPQGTAAALLAAPTNKGRLESAMSLGQALLGGIASGMEAYDRSKAKQLSKAQSNYQNTLKNIELIDALRNRQEAADLQNALNNQATETTEDTYVKLNVDNKGSGAGSAVDQYIDNNSATTVAADVWNTVDNSPNAFSKTARVLGGALPGDDLAKRNWVAQQAPVLGGVELSKLQKMMPNGFSGAINSAVEQKLMMPVRDALVNGTASQIKAAIQTYFSGYYDELAKQYYVQSNGKSLPFSKEDFISNQLTTNARYYNTNYDPSNPSEPMYLSRKVETASGFDLSNYGAELVE